MSENIDNKKGVWRTVKGRHIFIKDGQNLTEAMQESGKFVEKAAKEIIDVTDNKKAAKNEISNILGKEYRGYKGQNAVDKLIKEKQGHIKGAFQRDDIGYIDLLWGDDTCGLQHIIKRREEQGIDVQEFLKNITDTVEKGEFIKKNEKGNFEFWFERKMVVISPELRGNTLTFLLTAFKRSKK